MSPKVVLGDSAHGDSHPSLYKGNHRDYHFSLLPFLVSFPFGTIYDKHSRWNAILSSKVLDILCRYY